MIMMEIRNLKWLEMISGDEVLYGLDQKWYGQRFRKNAGCAPVTAATLLLYMNKRESGPLRYDNTDMENAALILDDVWEFVRPGLMGLYNIKKFVKGIHNLCGHYGVNWECRYMKSNKNTLTSEAAEFIKSGIGSDCPVAFLNLHEGAITEFEGWHWFVLTGIRSEEGIYIASGIDGGKQMEFNLTKWMKSTRFGGGFVYIRTKT